MQEVDADQFSASPTRGYHAADFFSISYPHPLPPKRKEYHKLNRKHECVIYKPYASIFFESVYNVKAHHGFREGGGMYFKRTEQTSSFSCIQAVCIVCFFESCRVAFYFLVSWLMESQRERTSKCQTMNKQVSWRKKLKNISSPARKNR